MSEFKAEEVARLKEELERQVRRTEELWEGTVQAGNPPGSRAVYLTYADMRYILALLSNSQQRIETPNE